MTDLVSVGGICFVAGTPVQPETEKTGETAVRKNRPRGERSRKEQRKAAWAKYYAEHRAEHLAKQIARHRADPEKNNSRLRKYRAEHPEEVKAYHRAYYAAHRDRILMLSRVAYRKRKLKS